MFVDIKLDCSNFVQNALGVQKEETIRELQAMLSMKGQEIEYLHAKVLVVRISGGIRLEHVLGKICDRWNNLCIGSFSLSYVLDGSDCELDNEESFDNMLYLYPTTDRIDAKVEDFLPDPASDGFHDHVMELRERAKEIPDDYFVVLVGDMITEEGLPTYQTMLNTLDGVRDETGASPTSWAVWTRAWTAEENRHGDLLNKYLYLCGRVDMRQIEKTIQYLIGSGMDPGFENSPYLCFIYTSFQERATFISHGNTARHAQEHGDSKLAQICGTIASDEKRHETAYTKIVEKLFEIDPDATMLALADMMKKKITMPAHLMYDGRDDNLFEHFSSVAQRLGVYTTKDYADILEFLVGRWRVEEITGLSSEGRKAQDYVCALPQRIRRLAPGRAKEARYVPFSWIFDKEVKI
ncbi:hypothetical protein RHSIM_Rhsim09G0009100 [Rhododendron simsii]|uniref:Acyl-[acyl-carrier-protein] desaturase n=1 Tax=Rhododendron simsii TaxID=118357 RepID=A0A834GDT5_RHOSS|nr:hypothetical protein RHSIM_Rhsim09G0009100 [Rhododendron simsii]